MMSRKDIALFIANLSDNIREEFIIFLRGEPMRIYLSWLLGMAMLILSGCHSLTLAEKNQVTIYSIAGESQDIELVNGLIVSTPEQEIFYKGKLLFLNEEDWNKYFYEVNFYFSESGSIEDSYIINIPTQQFNNNRHAYFEETPYYQSINLDEEGIDLGTLVSQKGYFRESQENLYVSVRIGDYEEYETEVAAISILNYVFIK